MFIKISKNNTVRYTFESYSY